jgi:hypothetical protein
MDLIVDPGQTQTGIAAYMPGISAPWCAKIKQPTTADVHRVLLWALELDPAFTLVLEGQHLRAHGPKQQINWPSVTTLMLAAHRWIVVGELLCVPQIEIVQPGEWQGPMFRAIETHDEDGKKLTQKQRSKRYVGKQWITVGRLELPVSAEPELGADVETETPASALGEQVLSSKIATDECDAAVMGRWWRLQGKAKRPPG